MVKSSSDFKDAVAEAATELEGGKDSQEEITESENDSENESEESEAADEVDEDSSEEEETSKKSKKEDKDEEEEEDDSTTEYDEEIRLGLNLLRQLRDPKTSADLIKDLAVKAGIINPSETLTREETKSLKELISETIGEDYPDMAKGLEKILAVSQERQEKEIARLRKEIEARDKQAAAKTLESEFSSFISENKLTEKEARLMVKQIEELPPSSNITLKAYMGKIYKLIKSDTIDAQKKIDLNKKRIENKKGQVKNLSSEADDRNMKKGSNASSSYLSLVQEAAEELAETSSKRK